jgi:hypothetical protein
VQVRTLGAETAECTLSGVTLRPCRGVYIVNATVDVWRILRGEVYGVQCVNVIAADILQRLYVRSEPLWLVLGDEVLEASELDDLARAFDQATAPAWNDRADGRSQVSDEILI